MDKSNVLSFGIPQSASERVLSCMMRPMYNNRWSWGGMCVLSAIRFLMWRMQSVGSTVRVMVSPVSNFTNICIGLFDCGWLVWLVSVVG